MDIVLRLGVADKQNCWRHSGIIARIVLDQPKLQKRVMLVYLSP